MLRRRHRFLVPVFVLAMVTVGSCGDGRDAQQGSTSSPAPTTAPAVETPATTAPLVTADSPSDTGDLVVPGCDLVGAAVPDAVVMGDSESRVYVTGVLLEGDDGLVMCEVADGVVTPECETKRLPIEGVTIEDLDAQGVHGSDASFPITLVGELVDGVLHVQTPRYIGPTTIGLDAGVNYSTSPTRVPLVLLTPPASGWTARDSIACGDALGSLWLRSDDGWMFVVPTLALTVDDAVEQLLNNDRLTDATVADTSFGPWAGSSVAATFVDLPDRILRGLLPYHTVTEDVPDVGSMPSAGRVEVHVVATRSGVLSIVLLADESAVDDLRMDALALAATIEVIATYPGCADEEWADKVCWGAVTEDNELVEPDPTDGSGCAVGVGPSSIEPGVPIPEDHAYVVERADAYVGIVVRHPATEQVIDGFEWFGRFAGTGHGGIFTYRRGGGEDLEFLGLVIDHDQGDVTTDAIRLATNGDAVFLEASCQAKALVLRPGNVVPGPDLSLDGAVQSWRVDELGDFFETSEPGEPGCG